MKIMAIVDRHGLPLSVSTHAANHHEVRLVQLCFDFYMIEAKPENLIGDRAYDSDPLDEELSAQMQNMFDFPPAPKLTVTGRLDPVKATAGELAGERLFFWQSAMFHLPSSAGLSR